MDRQATNRGRPGGGRGFTIVELLVVISIITVLMAILLPALASARVSAQTAVCSSNIRQLAIANIAYAGRNDSFYCLGAEDYGTTNLRRWHGTREPSAGWSNNNPFDPTKGPLSPYFGVDKVKECPMLIGVMGGGLGYEVGSGGYGYNLTSIGARPDKFPAWDPRGYMFSARIDDVRRPSATIMFADVAGRQWPGNELVEESTVYAPYTVSQDGLMGQTQPTMHFRHNHSTNTVMVDGHVERRGAEFAFDNPWGPETARWYLDNDWGWFGPDSNEYFDLH